MTDFLTSLTARSLGTETAIRPRVASLFEPAPQGDVVPPEAPVAELTETVLAREIEVESDGERKMNRGAPALRKDGEPSDAKYHANESSVAAIVSQPRSDSERRKSSVVADATRDKKDTVVAAKVLPRRASLSEEENASESVPALRSDSEGGAPILATAPAASPDRGESPDKEFRGLVLPPMFASELTSQMKDAALAMNAEHGAPVKEKSGSALPALAAEPEPSVHVTIGRIEVRATSEIKQESRPRPVSPVMSLDEYLHQRAQRGGQ
jgi:hypothetical protein